MGERQRATTTRLKSTKKLTKLGAGRGVNQTLGRPVVSVVVLFPVGDDCASFVNVVAGIHVQAFVTYATVEGFNVPVAPGLTGW